MCRKVNRKTRKLSPLKEKLEENLSSVSSHLIMITEPRQRKVIFGAHAYSECTDQSVHPRKLTWPSLTNYRITRTAKYQITSRGFMGLIRVFTIHIWPENTLAIFFSWLSCSLIGRKRYMS